MAWLAPGIIAVEDEANECDVFFEIERWKFTHPQIWQKTPRMPEDGIDVLPGTGKAPAVRTIEEMVTMAQEHLTPIGDIAFYEAPKFFDF